MITVKNPPWMRNFVLTQALQGKDRAEEQEEKEGESGRKVRGGSEWEGEEGGEACRQAHWQIGSTLSADFF